MMKQVMPCVMCKASFSADDVRHGLFFVSTMVCDNCYHRGQKLPHKIWCFGKRNIVRRGKVVAFGFDKTAPECSGECPDRRICRAFVQITKIQAVRDSYKSLAT